MFFVSIKLVSHFNISHYMSGNLLDNCFCCIFVYHIVDCKLFFWCVPYFHSRLLTLLFPVECYVSVLYCNFFYAHCWLQAFSDVDQANQNHVERVTGIAEEYMVVTSKGQGEKILPLVGVVPWWDHWFISGGTIAHL